MLHSSVYVECLGIIGILSPGGVSKKYLWSRLNGMLSMRVTRSPGSFMERRLTRLFSRVAMFKMRKIP